MLTRFLIIFFLSLPIIAETSQHISEDPPDYTLEVLCDIKASRITGVATITVKGGRELIVQKGELQFIHVSFDKQEIVLSGQDETLRILPSHDGIVEIKYEGAIRHPERLHDVEAGKSRVLSTIEESFLQECGIQKLIHCVSIISG